MRATDHRVLFAAADDPVVPDPGIPGIALSPPLPSHLTDINSASVGAGAADSEYRWPTVTGRRLHSLCLRQEPVCDRLPYRYLLLSAI